MNEFSRVKSNVDGPNDWNWTIMYQTRLKVDGIKRVKVDSLRNWTVLASKLDGQNRTVLRIKVNGPKDRKWMIQEPQNERYKRAQVDGLVITIGPSTFDLTHENLEDLIFLHIFILNLTTFDRPHVSLNFENFENFISCLYLNE